jgi:hypothetical protein
VTGPGAVLLIHPPVAKACEPPAGIARLAAALRIAGKDCRVLDANLEGQLALLSEPVPAVGTWTRRALTHRAAHQAALRCLDTYRAPARHARAVSDLNRLLAAGGAASGAVVSLADYQEQARSPCVVPTCWPPQPPRRTIPFTPGSAGACRNCSTAWRSSASPSTT